MVDVYNFSEQKESDPVFQSVDTCEMVLHQKQPYPLFTITF
jgi:hypothetical protein